MTCLTYSFRLMPSGSPAWSQSSSMLCAMITWSTLSTTLTLIYYFLLDLGWRVIPHLLIHLQTALSSTMATPLILIACLGSECAMCSGGRTAMLWFRVSDLVSNNTRELVTNTISSDTFMLKLQIFPCLGNTPHTISYSPDIHHLYCLSL